MSKSHTGSGWASDAPTPAQVKEFFAQIESGRITKGRLQAFLRGETVESPKSFKQQIQEWRDFYKKYFGLEIGEDVHVPEHQAGFDRLIIVPRELARDERPLNWVYSVCAKEFPCWRYSKDLDKDVTLNDRDPNNGTYTIWVRDRQEADEENKNFSADDLAEHKMPCITLLERMLYELKYWNETQKHLDMDNISLCAGSRSSDGDVPPASWSDGKFGVHWHCSGNRDDNLRSRSVVSCQPKPERA